MKEDEKTYGGFLPFELGRGHEYYQYNKEQIQYYNSGKTAAYYCIMQMKPKRLFVPRYYCPSTKRAIEKAAADIGTKVIYYHVSRNLSVNCPDRSTEKETRNKDNDFYALCNVRTPDTVDFIADNVEITCDDAILLVNYFGVCRSYIGRWLKTGFNLIIDNCQAFFSEPVIADKVLNFYSLKKDFGTPDGAFVIGEHVKDYHLQQENGIAKCDYLLGSLVEGTDKWYKRKKEVDEEIAANRLGASAITRMMIKTIDYEGVKSKRVANLKLYEEAFGADNLIRPDEDSVPYLYPLNLGIDIRKKLIANKIFAPTLWADTLEEIYSGTGEYLLSKNTAFLPLDQRYDKDDIKYIINIVNEIVHSYGRLG